MANHWHPTAEQLEELCREDPRRPRILVLNYPCNPTGRTFSTEELEDLARVAREHHALILSDEIYGKLHHQDKHISIARFYPEGTIFSGGLSKWCGAGGWRLGLFVFRQRCGGCRRRWPPSERRLTHPPALRFSTPQSRRFEKVRRSTVPCSITERASGSRQPAGETPCGCGSCRFAARRSFLSVSRFLAIAGAVGGKRDTHERGDVSKPSRGHGRCHPARE